MNITFDIVNSCYSQLVMFLTKSPKNTEEANTKPLLLRGNSGLGSYEPMVTS